MLIRGGCQEGIINGDFDKVLKEQARDLSLREIKEFLANVDVLQEAVSKNVNPRLALEWLMLNLPGSENRKHAVPRFRQAVS